MMGTAPCAMASKRRLELGLSPEIMKQNSDCCSRCEYSAVWLALWSEQSTHLPHQQGQHLVGAIAVRCHHAASLQRERTRKPLSPCALSKSVIQPGAP